ncbi:hypothetical protein PanWU01x14_139870 [Parasponia andersonii]|uniref:Uncharacterized protein n=1 Tax=Parasponia andersonii TaxID=3476 RepID=A0A2P5CMK7_PARAD|nr:hypothetical protein PanWU01x14_139870 [Parasponia andersonii]
MPSPSEDRKESGKERSEAAKNRQTKSFRRRGRGGSRRRRRRVLIAGEIVVFARKKGVFDRRKKVLAQSWRVRSVEDQVMIIWPYDDMISWINGVVMMINNSIELLKLHYTKCTSTSLSSTHLWKRTRRAEKKSLKYLGEP